MLPDSGFGIIIVVPEARVTMLISVEAMSLEPCRLWGSILLSPPSLLCPELLSLPPTESVRASPIPGLLATADAPVSIVVTPPSITVGLVDSEVPTDGRSSETCE